MLSKHKSHWLEREDKDDITVVRLKTATIMDEDIERAVFDPIYSLVSDMGRSQLILNLAAVNYVPSSVLGKLVLLNRKAEAAGGRLVLCQVSNPVAKILYTTHLNELFNICSTEQEALQAFEGHLMTGSADALALAEQPEASLHVPTLE
jgi:anti-sigma B factor antagonist